MSASDAPEATVYMSLNRMDQAHDALEKSMALFRENGVLQSVDLSGNSVDDKTALALADALSDKKCTAGRTRLSLPARTVPKSHTRKREKSAL